MVRFAIETSEAGRAGGDRGGGRVPAANQATANRIARTYVVRQTGGGIVVHTEFLRHPIRDNRVYNSDATSIRITRSRGLFAVTFRRGLESQRPYGDVASSRDGETGYR